MQQDTYARTRSPADEAGYTGAHESGDASSTVSTAAQTATEAARDEASNVAQTAKQEAGAVVDEAKGQVRRLASEARDQAGTRVRGGHNQVVERLRGFADELGEMGGDGNTPVKAVVSDLSERGRRVADYLADRGPEGLLNEVQDFARRRPMAFLAGALAAGFVVGRLGKNVIKAQSDTGSQGYQAETTGTTYQSTGTYEAPLAASVAAEPMVAPVETSYGSTYPGVAQPAAPVETTPGVGAPQWTEPPSPYASETYAEETLPAQEYPAGQDYPAQPYQGGQQQGGDRP